MFRSAETLIAQIPPVLGNSIPTVPNALDLVGWIIVAVVVAAFIV
jgi:hypothetical protein